MKRRILLGCLLPLAIVGVGSWLGFRTLWRADARTSRTEVVTRGDVEIKVTETGTIEPLRKVEVKSKVAGRIAKLYVKEGYRVQAGQLLAEIDPTEINSQVAQIRAQLDGARARLEQAKKGVTYQVDQTRASIQQYEEAVRAAQARLKMALEEEKSQPERTRAEIAQAEASLKAAQDSLSLLKNSTHPQAVVQAQSGYADAQASAESARRNLERQQKLLERGFVSQQVVDAAKAEMAAANARLEQAKKRLELIEEQNRLEIANAESRVAQERAALERAKTGVVLNDIKAQEVLSARAALQQAQAQLRAAQAGVQQDRMRQDEVAQAKATVVQLENQLREFEVRQHDTRLLAPMSGVVTLRYVEEGELVMSGVSSFSAGTPVVQIADLSQMLVKMSVNEVDVHKIRPGLPVEITIDGARGVIFAGHVRSVAPAALGSGAQGAGGQGGGVVRFAVEVLADRSDSRLKPGMSAKCTIVIARRKNVLRLPNECVEGEGANAKVQVWSQAIKNGKKTDVFTPRPITISLRGDTHVEILSGLKEGERVKPGVYTGPKRRSLDINID